MQGKFRLKPQLVLFSRHLPGIVLFCLDTKKNQKKSRLYKNPAILLPQKAGSPPKLGPTGLKQGGSLPPFPVQNRDFYKAGFQLLPRDGVPLRALRLLCVLCMKKQLRLKTATGPDFFSARSATPLCALRETSNPGLKPHLALIFSNWPMDGFYLIF